MLRMSRTHVINIDPDKVREVFARGEVVTIRYFDKVEIVLTCADAAAAEKVAEHIADGIEALWAGDAPAEGDGPEGEPE